jgi:hypothetical protein
MKRENFTVIGAAALFNVLTIACTTDVDVWVTSGAESSSGDAPDTSTTETPDTGDTEGLSASETSSGAGSSESTTSDTGSGDGSSSSTGAPGNCVLDPASWACLCDGQPAHPSECDCFGDPLGWCTCPEGSIEQECPGACFVTDGVCECWGEAADPLQCGCVLDEVIDACVCNEHEIYPPETCALSEAECSIVVDAAGSPWCRCGGALADPALCGCEGTGEPGCGCEGFSCGQCEVVGALCLCGKIIAPLESCEK